MRDLAVVQIGPAGMAWVAIGATAVVTFSLVVPILVGAARRSLERISQVVEAHLKPALFPPKHLDLLTLQRRIVLVALREVSVSVAGIRYMARNIAVRVSPADHWRLDNGIDGGIDRIGTDLATEVSRRATKLGYEVPDDLRVAILRSALTVDGRPAQAELRPPPPRSSPQPSPTRRQSSPSRTPTYRRSPVPLTELGDETWLGATRRWLDPKMAAHQDKTVDIGADTVSIEEATLLSKPGGDVQRVCGRRTTIGRADSGRAVDIGLNHRSVSTAHAELICDRGIWTVKDSASKNGTYVNNERIHTCQLDHGDQIQFSCDGPTYTFHLSTVDGPQSATVQAGRLRR